MMKSAKRCQAPASDAASVQPPQKRIQTMTEDGTTEIKGLGDAKVRMPMVGFGTYRFKDGAAHRATTEALRAGYRLIDTAFCYGGEKTEGDVGKALNAGAAPVPRSEVFVTTKHWRAYHGYEETLTCLDLSLKRLNLPFVDLYLMHWPGPAYTVMGKSKAVMAESPLGPFVYAKKGHERTNLKALRAETWRAMEDAQKAGKCRAIGVSNFTVAHLEALRETAVAWPPAVNQVEMHPYAPQKELRAYCAEHGILVQAYASLGGQDASKGTLEPLGGHLMRRPEVLALAKKHEQSPAGVLLKWASQLGVAVIPKSSSASRMAENFNALIGSGSGSGSSKAKGSWGLDDGDMAVLDSLDQTHHEGVDARLCWKTDPLKHLEFE